MANRKKKERIKLTDEAAITPELVRYVLRKCLQGRLRMPTEAAIHKLSIILERWRQHYIGCQVFVPLKREAGLRAGQLLATLHNLKIKYEAGTAVVPTLKRKIEKIDDAVYSICCLQEEEIVSETVEVLGWKWLSNALPGDFIEAIHTTNPGREIGISDNGPLSRFIAAIAPHLTGEHPTARSVSTQLKVLRSHASRR